MVKTLLDTIPMSIGKKTRLYRMMYHFGPKKGKLLILPIDQGLEHGPVDFFGNEESADPHYQFKIAIHGGYSAIALHYGLAEKYYDDYAGKIPLVLKVNGKTNIPSDAGALSPLTGTVEDAVRLGADAVGYTIYVGSPNQEADFTQFLEIREKAEYYGMPVIVWSYPRGEAIEKKGGKDSFYAIDYASRVALELGADVIKINLPEKTTPESPKPYNEMSLSTLDMAKHAVKSAGRALVIFSGGSKISDEDLLSKVKTCMDAGAVGLIFGRNIWQRKYEEAIRMTEKIKKIMKEQ